MATQVNQEQRHPRSPESDMMYEGGGSIPNSPEHREPDSRTQRNSSSDEDEDKDENEDEDEDKQTQTQTQERSKPDSSS